MSTQMIIILLLILFMIVMFVWNKVPYGVTTMTVCALFVILGVADTKTAFAGLSNATTIMMACMLTLSIALGKTGLIRTIQKQMDKLSGKSGAALMIMMFAFTILLSQMIGQTAVIVTMMIFIGNMDDSKALSRSRMLFAVFAVSDAWEARFPIGMGATLPALTNSFYQGMVGKEYLVGMFDLMKVGIIPAIALTVYSFFAWKLIPNQPIDLNGNGSAAKKDTAPMPAFNERMIYILFVLVILSFCFAKKLGDLSNVIPVIAILILIYTKALSIPDVIKGLTSDMIWMVAGMLTISSVLGSSGVGKMIGEFVLSILGTNPSGLYVTTVFCVVTIVMTTFLSNSGTTAILTPIAVSTALAGGMNPKSVAIVINLTCWFALAFPTGSSGAAVTYAAGHYNPITMLKFNIPYILIAVATTILSVNLFFPIYG